MPQAAKASHHSFVSDRTTRPCAAAALVLLMLAAAAGGCKPYDRYVQVAERIDEFTPFSGLRRDIAYGPYCLNVTGTGAVIAWGENAGAREPRHVAVTLTGLSRATEYLYRVHGADRDGRVLTAPGGADAFSFLAVGDTQMNAEISSRIAGAMTAADPSASFVLHLGDMVEIDSGEHAWQEQWWDPLAELLLRFPVYPVAGNHDVLSRRFNRYFQPVCDNGFNNYFFDWGGVHFAVLDFNPGKPALAYNANWLIQDLRSHAGADFTVICHHYPVISTITDSAQFMAEMQNILIPTYEYYGVDMVLSGHAHNYQHHVNNGIHYIVSGGGGGKLSDPGPPIEGITAYQRKTYHFLRCTVRDGVLTVTAHDADGCIFDRLAIRRN